MPPGIVDRAADAWEPLLAIVELSGGDWPALGRAGNVEPTTTVIADDTDGVRLLADIRAVFDPAAVARMFSATIVERLNALEEAPWPAGTAVQGSPPEIWPSSCVGSRSHSTKVRIGTESKRGYYSPTSPTRGLAIRVTPPHPL